MVDPTDVAEGTPVVNEQGALVGLCTVAAGTVQLVPITDALPEGIVVVGVAPLADRAPALQEAVTAVEWEIEVADGMLVQVGRRKFARVRR